MKQLKVILPGTVRTIAEIGRSAVPETQRTPWSEHKDYRTHRTAVETGKGEPEPDAPQLEAETLSVDRVYPHLYDRGSSTGTAMSLVEKAASDVRGALTAFDGADLATVSSRMASLAAVASSAQTHASFNRSFRATLGFIRRAALVVDSAEVSRSALNSMLTVLNQLSNRPTLDLMGAAELTERLAKEGWHGEHKEVEALIKTLIDDQDVKEDAITQVELFEAMSVVGSEGAP